MKAKALGRIPHKRGLFSNKYSNGRILVIGGNSSYYGAPVLALNSAYQCLAALRTGAGYAKAFVPASILDTARSLSPNTIIQPLGRKEIEFNSTIKAEIQKADVIIIGMGTGQGSSKASEKTISYAIEMGKKVIADADAIYQVRKLKVKARDRLAITPHDGEFYRLTGTRPSQKDLKQRTETAVSAARKYNCIVVLKGHYTIITDGKRTRVNRAKTAALATMGTGDVLSGIIGGFAATRNDLFEAAAAGVYLHSRIGDILYKEKGNHIIATDLIERIPQMLKKHCSN